MVLKYADGMTVKQIAEDTGVTVNTVNYYLRKAYRKLNILSREELAYVFSATAFSLYHVAMMIGWFSPALFLLVMAGLMAGGMIFNYLNEKLDTIYCSWLTHMFANFAINTIGFILLQ